MKPLQECLEMARGKPPQEFANLHPHPVLIGLGVLPGDLQRNPAKASGTLFMNLSPDQSGSSTTGPDPLLNQVFVVTKVSSQGAPAHIQVGDNQGSDINIPDHTVSKNHAIFILDPSGAMHLVDGGSTNGTFVNGARMSPRTPTAINSGDIITFGRNSFTYYDALSFAKLLSVQAMMRPRGAPRRVQRGRPTTQLGGGRPSPPQRRKASLSPRRGGTQAPPVVDPFLGPPRSGRFSTPEQVRKAASSTDPRRAFQDPENTQTVRGPSIPQRRAPHSRHSRPQMRRPSAPPMNDAVTTSKIPVAGQSPFAQNPAPVPRQHMPTDAIPTQLPPSDISAKSFPFARYIRAIISFFRRLFSRSD